MSLGPISTEKHCCDNAHSALFLPPSTMSTSFSATENKPVLFKQAICFRPFCSSRAMKRHHHMGKSSLEQPTSHSSRGRRNPKGYVTKILLKSILGYTWHNIQKETHEEITVTQLIKYWPQREVIWWMHQSFLLTEVPGIEFWVCYLFVLPFSALCMARATRHNQTGTGNDYVHY